VVAISGDQPGVEIDPHPPLLDLQATFSSSLRFDGVRIDDDAILSFDGHRFIRAVRPTFLLWQASFAWGLAARALSEAAAHVGRGPNRVFARELESLREQRDRIEVAISTALDARSRAVETVATGPAVPGELAEVVAVRLAAAHLAGAASRLESKVVGGAGYASGSATARRLREAAFLPIQSPTEGQLEWELSRSR
jgi:alkylation response protein AidB-like acyl-CoA dehydrogenase